MENTRATKLVPEKIIKPITYKLDYKEFIIYSLSIGFNEDQLNKKHYKFTYELSDDFTVFPTFLSVLPIQELINILQGCPYIPEFNPMLLLHGEETVEFLKPIPTTGDLTLEAEFADVEDKGKGTVLCIRINVLSKSDLIALLTTSLFVKGLKGEGAKSVGPLKNQIPKIPNVKPLKEVVYKTSNNQTLYYRIGGNDPNPLHVDPDMAAIGGFEKPILHGLCTYGMTGRAVYELFCEGNQENIIYFKARFTSHVFPGESLKFEFFNNENRSLIVSVKNVERGTTVLVGEIKLKNSKF